MELERLWKSTMAEMELRISRANFATWFKGSKAMDRKEGILLVGLPNNFAKEWVANKYHKDLLGIVRNFDDAIRKLEFLVATDAPAPTPVSHANPAPTAPMQNRIQLEFKVDPESNLNSKYMLKNFIVGPSNELAHAAAAAIIDEPGTKYNPFFVYGGVGLGKTHLIQAIGNEIKEKFKGQIRPRYVSSEKFTTDVVWAIRNKRMEDIKKKYREVDVLIIDDIQFIGGKEKTEEEFFHTFNALYQNNKQIIISSDRPPHSIPTLEDRLRSRFEGGLIADIAYPEYETRVAIIKAKCSDKNISLDDEIVDIIAKKVKKNIREIEGILQKIDFYKDKRADLSKRAVEEIIDRSIQSIAKPVTDLQVLAAVAEFYQIKVEDLTGRCRKKEVVEPRQVAMYLLRDILGLSYPYIGDKMGRDHTTAIHSYEKINEEVNKNPGLNQKIFQIKEVISKS
jgi:chromosomal replication initiator protein